MPTCNSEQLADADTVKDTTVSKVSSDLSAKCISSETKLRLYPMSVPAKKMINSVTIKT